jgi:hypothetical protein
VEGDEREICACQTPFLGVERNGQGCGSRGRRDISDAIGQDAPSPDAWRSYEGALDGPRSLLSAAMSRVHAGVIVRPGWDGTSSIRRPM